MSVYPCTWNVVTETRRKTAHLAIHCELLVYIEVTVEKQKTKNVQLPRVVLSFGRQGDQAGQARHGPTSHWVKILNIWNQT